MQHKLPMYFHKIDRGMEQIACNICPMCQFHKIDREMEQNVCKAPHYYTSMQVGYSLKVLLCFTIICTTFTLLLLHPPLASYIARVLTAQPYLATFILGDVRLFVVKSHTKYLATTIRHNILPCNILDSTFYLFSLTI